MERESVLWTVLIIALKSPPMSVNSGGDYAKSCEMAYNVESSRDGGAYTLISVHECPNNRPVIIAYLPKGSVDTLCTISFFRKMATPLEPWV